MLSATSVSFVGGLLFLPAIVVVARVIVPSALEHDHGATFIVRLPVMGTHHSVWRDADASSGRAAALLERADRSAGGIRVVTIGDEEDALTWLRVVLETAGAEVTTLSSGPAAFGRDACAVNPEHHLSYTSARTTWRAYGGSTAGFQLTDQRLAS